MTRDAPDASAQGWERRITTDLEWAAESLRAGELVVFPTETVYGLGADATEAAAIAKIYRAKGRPADNPLIVHVAERAWVTELIDPVHPYVNALLEEFSPGPLTIVGLRAKHDRRSRSRGVLPDPAREDCSTVCAEVSAGMPTVAIRIPAHALAREFLRRCRRPVAAPSANLSGRPSATTLARALEDLGQHVAAAIDGGPCDDGIESTVIDVTGTEPQILRPGSVSLHDLQRVVPTARLATADALKERSPGTRHQHYAPRASVVLVDRCPDDPPADSAFIGLEAPRHGERLALVRVHANARDYAHALFEFMREADARGLERIFAQRVAGAGVELALMDRLERAASR